MGEEVLELKTRRKVFDCIAKNPGLHKLELQRKLDITYSNLDYHIRILIKRNLINSQTEGGYTRYYAMGEIGTKDKKILGMLRQKITRKIILFLLLNPKSSHGEIKNHLEVAASTTTFHLKKLMELEVITFKKYGKEKLFYVIDEEAVSDLLISFRRGFFDKAVDKFVVTWMDKNRKHLKKK